MKHSSVPSGYLGKSAPDISGDDLGAQVYAAMEAERQRWATEGSDVAFVHSLDERTMLERLYRWWARRRQKIACTEWLKRED